MATATLRDLFGANLLAPPVIPRVRVQEDGRVYIRRAKKKLEKRDNRVFIRRAKKRAPPPSSSTRYAKSPMASAIRGLRGGADLERSDIIDACGESLEAFCLEYLPHHFPAPFCVVHQDIFAACDAPSPSTGKRIARAAPRKFGKTTIISLAKPLQDLAYKRKRYILLVGETATTAEANLGTLTAEIENNEKLLRDFPHLKPAIDKKGQNVKWTDKQIVFSSFQTVRAVGMGAKSRGIKYRQNRPDSAICDDLESTESADTFLKRRKHKIWWGGTFMGLGAKGWDIYYIGNLIHKDCLLASLLVDKLSWDSKLWRAKNVIKDEEPYPSGHTSNDGEPIWPEVWGHAELEAYKNTPEVGEFNFAREMMNDPRTKEEQYFDYTQFTFYDHSPTQEARYLRKLTYVDPAGGEQPAQIKKGRRDYCAVVTGGVNPDDHWIEIYDVRLNRLVPDLQIEKVLDVYMKHRAPIQAEEIMYKNLYGSAMSKAAAARGLYPPITLRDVHGQNKNGRIMGTQPLIMHQETRKVRFARHLIDDVPEYFAQYDEFPGEYDDGPDATEGVIRGLERPAPPKSLVSSSLQTASRWRGM